MDKKDDATVSRITNALAKDGELIAANATIRQLNKRIEALQAELTATKGELEALKAAQTWQPIETAPKDGTEIIIGKHLCWPLDSVCPADDPRTGGGFYCAGAYFFHDGAWRNRIAQYISEPTHWMPLPPTDSEGGCGVIFRVYRHGEHPKPKRHFYPNEFGKRQQARAFCRNRSWEAGLTIVHPDGSEEKYTDTPAEPVEGE